MSKLLVILFLIPLILTACKLEGTNTGNPDSVSQTGDPQSPGVGKKDAYSLATLICYKINKCFAQVSANECYSQIIKTENYTSELGPNASAYKTLTAIWNAEEKNEIIANANNFDACSESIQLLPCDHSLVQLAYSETAPAEYSKTNLLFRSSTSCQHIY